MQYSTFFIQRTCLEKDDQKLQGKMKFLFIKPLLYLQILFACGSAKTLGDSEVGENGSNSTGLSIDQHTRLPEEQKRALETLKSKILPKMTEDFMKTDIYILKFLKAKNFDVEKAELFLLNHINWWEENQMHNIQEEDWSEVKKEFPYTIDGYDREGRPILLMDFGKWKIGTADKAGKFDRIKRYYDKMLDEAERKVMKLQGEGKNITEFIWLVNLDGVSIAEQVNIPSSRFYWHTSIIYENNHPGTSYKLYLINSPRYFDLIMGIIRPLLTPKTNDIFQNFGDKREWKGLVDDLIDPNQLPGSYGGKKGSSKQLVNSFQRHEDGSWSWIPSWFK